MQNSNEEYGVRLAVLESDHNHTKSKVATIESSLEKLAESVKQIQLTLARLFGKETIIAVLILMILGAAVNNVIEKLIN